MARLHIICGNCGCADEFEYEIVKDGQHLADGTIKDAVWIWCRNCTTLHDLSEKMPERVDDD